jgi:hypothetical protein
LFAFSRSTKVMMGLPIPAVAQNLREADLLAVRGETAVAQGQASRQHRDERGARLAMSRRARISGIFGLLSEEARRDAAFVPQRGGFALECRQTFTTGC